VNSSMESTPILIAEDDLKIADMLGNYLRAQGWHTHVVHNGVAAVNEVRLQRASIVLLDLMLPGLDGLEVCRSIREFSSVPIIMLTARIDEVDRLLGLESGADDYVCKPFSPREVAARVKAQWRRVTGQFRTMSHGGFDVNEAAQRILWQGRALDLTTSEYRILRALLMRAGAILSRAQLLDAVRQEFRDTADRTVDSHIRNLRRKLENVRPQGSGITAVYGVGYRFDP